MQLFFQFFFFFFSFSFHFLPRSDNPESLVYHPGTLSSQFNHVTLVVSPVGGDMFKVC
jgi:hypothetical protein